MRNSMRRQLRRPLVAACAVAFPALALAGHVHAQEAKQPFPIIAQLELRDARLEEAVTILTSKTGTRANVVIIPGNYAKVTLRLSDVALDIALKAVADAGGATLTESDGIFFLRPQTAPAPKPEPVKPVTEPTAVQAPPRRASRILAKVELKYLPPRDFVKMIDDPNYAFMMNMLMPDTGPRGILPINIAPGYLTPAPNGNVPGQLGNTGTTDGAAGAGQRGGGLVGGPGGGGFGGQGRGGGGFGQGGGGFGQGGGNQGGFPGQGGQGGQGQQSLRPVGIDNIVVSDADNSLIVQGDAGAIEELKAIIRLLDVAPRQLQIKAEFVSVSIQDADAFGIDWRFSLANNLDTNIPPLAGATPTVTVAYASGNAVANLRASLNKTTSNILQAPIISTSNNIPAFITVSDTVTIPVSTVVPQFNGPPIVATSQQAIPAVNSLSVTPHINGDNTISLQLTPQLQTISITSAPGGGIQTRTQTQALNTFRRLRNGETMVIGGFITSQEDRSEVRVPLLSSLPIIGSLFTQRSRTKNGTEILVFVTPTIIEDPVPGAGGGASL